MTPLARRRGLASESALAAGRWSAWRRPARGQRTSPPDPDPSSCPPRRPRRPRTESRSPAGRGRAAAQDGPAPACRCRQLSRRPRAVRPVPTSGTAGAAAGGRRRLPHRRHRPTHRGTPAVPPKAPHPDLIEGDPAPKPHAEPWRGGAAPGQLASASHPRRLRGPADRLRRPGFQVAGLDGRDQVTPRQVAGPTVAAPEVAVALPTLAAPERAVPAVGRAAQAAGREARRHAGVRGRGRSGPGLPVPRAGAGRALDGLQRRRQARQARPHPHDMACTGLATLAFLTADHTPAKEGPYRSVVAQVARLPAGPARRRRRPPRPQRHARRRGRPGQPLRPGHLHDGPVGGRPDDRRPPVHRGGPEGRRVHRQEPEPAGRLALLAAARRATPACSAGRSWRCTTPSSWASRCPSRPRRGPSTSSSPSATARRRSSPATCPAAGAYLRDDGRGAVRPAAARRRDQRRADQGGQRVPDQQPAAAPAGPTSTSGITPRCRYRRCRRRWPGATAGGAGTQRPTGRARPTCRPRRGRSGTRSPRHADRDAEEGRPRRRLLGRQHLGRARRAGLHHLAGDADAGSLLPLPAAAPAPETDADPLPDEARPAAAEVGAPPAARRTAAPPAAKTSGEKPRRGWNDPGGHFPRVEPN